MQVEYADDRGHEWYKAVTDEIKGSRVYEINSERRSFVSRVDEDVSMGGFDIFFQFNYLKK